MLILAALGAATVRRRFSAAVFLSAAGYAMAAFFVALAGSDTTLPAAQQLIGKSRRWCTSQL